MSAFVAIASEGDLLSNVIIMLQFVEWLSSVYVCKVYSKNSVSFIL